MAAGGAFISLFADIAALIEASADYLSIAGSRVFWLSTLEIFLYHYIRAFLFISLS